MPNPVTPALISAAVPSIFSNLCAAFKSMFLLAPLIKQWWLWAFDANGNATEDFKSLFVSIGVPVGGIIAWPVSGSLPSGFLAGNGQVVSRSTYPALFQVYGTRFGAGDGTTTFGLPNLSERVILGSSGAVAEGSIGGNATVSLVEANNGPHTHRPVARAQGEFAYNKIWGSSPDSTKTGRVYAHDHGLVNIASEEIPIETTLEDSGDGTAFSVLNPYFACTWLVKY